MLTRREFLASLAGAPVAYRLASAVYSGNVSEELASLTDRCATPITYDSLTGRFTTRHPASMRMGKLVWPLVEGQVRLETDKEILQAGRMYANFHNDPRFEMQRLVRLDEHEKQKVLRRGFRGNPRNTGLWEYFLDRNLDGRIEFHNAWTCHFSPTYSLLYSDSIFYATHEQLTEDQQTFETAARKLIAALREYGEMISLVL